MGINAAANGDFALFCQSDGRLCWQVFAPQAQSAHRGTAGWHRFTSAEPFALKQWHRVRAGWGPGGVSLEVDGEEVVSDPVVLSLSGNPLFVGDFPGDNNMGAADAVHLSMVGKVKNLKFGN